MKRRGMNGLTAWQAVHPRLSIVFPIALVFALVVLRFDWIRAALRWLAAFLAGSSCADGAQQPATCLAPLCRTFAAPRKARPGPAHARKRRWNLPLPSGLRPDLAGPVREFTELYAQARFGDKPAILPLRALRWSKSAAVPRPPTNGPGNPINAQIGN